MGKFYQQAKELTQKLTLKEKIGQMAEIVPGYDCYHLDENGEVAFSEDLKNAIIEYGGLGAISGLFRADPWTKKYYGTGITIEKRIDAANKLQQFIKDNTRLGIPALIEVEASHGMMSLGSVMYPTGIACAATFNPELYGEMMANIGTDISLSGNHVALVTLIDLARDPRWGRCEECLGEDALLASKLAEAGVKGLKRGGSLVCAKHFVGSGACEGGINCAEIHLGERELEEVYLPTAKACVDAGCDFIMVTYNGIDGTPCHINKKLLKDVLRKEYGYDGVIISDGRGVFNLVRGLNVDVESAAVLALKSGIDWSLVDGHCFTYLESAYQKGRVSMEEIDEACIRTLEKKFEAGLFDQSVLTATAPVTVNADKHYEKCAYKVAAESITLAKNNGVLPISAHTKIALIGETAEDIYHLLGDYTSERLLEEGATIKKAFEEKFNNVTYSKGWSFNSENNDFEGAIKAAVESDVIVFVLGGTSRRDFEAKYEDTGAVISTKNFMDCGEGIAVADISPISQQIELLKELKKTGKPIIALLINGRSYALGEVDKLADAVVIGWYPGQEGGYAIADVMDGTVNPSGKVSVTFPSVSGTFPTFYNSYNKAAGYVDAPNMYLYPFGHGLSYSTFKYDNLNVDYDGKNCKVSFTIENDSDIEGKEVAQLYIQVKGDDIKHRLSELKAFKKINIKPHEKVNVEFTLTDKDFALHSYDYSPNADIRIGNSKKSFLSCNIKL